MYNAPQEATAMIPSQCETSKMGRFFVSFEVANNDDLVDARRGRIEPEKVRRVTLLGLVDPGASRLVLPKQVVKQLGLPVTEHVKVTHADRRSAKRPVVQGVHVRLLNRESVFKATVESKRDTALIGALVLEDLDFLVDCAKQRLIPRDPRFILSEEE
jgi:predicted aspartyl protease